MGLSAIAVAAYEENFLTQSWMRLTSDSTNFWEISGVLLRHPISSEPMSLSPVVVANIEIYEILKTSINFFNLLRRKIWNFLSVVRI